MTIAKTRNRCGFLGKPTKIPCYFPCYWEARTLYMSPAGYRLTNVIGVMLKKRLLCGF